MSQQSPALLKAKGLNRSTFDKRSLNTSRRKPPIKSLFMGSAFSLLFIGPLTGCQTTTGISSVPVSTPEPQSNTKVIDSNSEAPVSSIDIEDNETEAEDDYPVFDPDSSPVEEKARPVDSINPVDQSAPVDQAEPIQHTNVESPVTPTYSDQKNRQQPEITDQRSVQQILLDQARQNSNQSAQRKPTIEDGSNIPAFKRLMDTGVRQLRQGQISAADTTFTRAQRLAPQSSAVYFYLGQVALKQNQPLKAEAMARRGLVVAKSNSRKKALWQVILKAAQAQGNSRVIKEARAALSH